MPSLFELWLPIALAAVGVFLVSSIAHMVLPHHHHDLRGLPGEERILAALRDAGVAAGDYTFPYAPTMREMGSPEMAAKLQSGPVGTLIVRPAGSLGLGKALAQWFAYCLLVGCLAAYPASLTLPRGVDGLLVMRVVGTASLLGYAFHNVSTSIWKAGSWATTLRFVIDGVVYASVTGASFAWLWPSAN